MKVAISTEGDSVSAHFGRCPSFTIAEIEEGRIVSKEVIENPGHHPAYLPQFLREKESTVLLPVVWDSARADSLPKRK